MPPKKKQSKSPATEKEIPEVRVSAPEDEGIDGERVVGEAELEGQGDDIESIPDENPVEEARSGPIDVDDDSDESEDEDDAIPPPGNQAAAPAPIVIPPSTRSRAQEIAQQMNAIAQNWGPEFRTLRGCLAEDTWTRGLAKSMTEHNCNMETLRRMRELSEKNPDKGTEMKQQIHFRWKDRSASGRVGSKQDAKETNLREDLIWLIEGKRMKEENIQKFKGKPKSDARAAPATKKGKMSRDVDENADPPKKRATRASVADPKKSNGDQKQIRKTPRKRRRSILVVDDSEDTDAREGGGQVDKDYDNDKPAAAKKQKKDGEEPAKKDEEKKNNDKGKQTAQDLPEEEDPFTTLLTATSKDPEAEQPALTSNIRQQPSSHNPAQPTTQAGPAVANLVAQAATHDTGNNDAPRAQPNPNTAPRLPLPATESALRRALDAMDVDDAEIWVRQCRRRITYLRDIGVATGVEESRLDVAVAQRDRILQYVDVERVREGMCGARRRGEVGGQSAGVQRGRAER